MLITSFGLNSVDKARVNWIGFLYATQKECEQHFDWLEFDLKDRVLEARGTLFERGKKFDFQIEYSPFYRIRFDRVYVKTKGLKQSFDTHFNSDGTLCLYHPKYDAPEKGYFDLKHIISMIPEWCYYYSKYLEYGVWIGPEHPH